VGRILASLILAGAPFAALAGPEKPAWLVGVWQLTQDEDGSPAGSDLDEFRADGHYVIYGPGCKESFGNYHLYEGDAYVTFDVPGKGPVAMIFRPSPDHSKLTYTSPRTRHNAVYERVTAPPCRGS
jgi:hypothetical protein